MKRNLTLILTWLLAATCAPTAVAGKPVATLIRVEGTIHITRYATGEKVAARRSGDRIRYASIDSNDEVRTSDSSNGTVELSDSSLWEVSRNTTFKVGEIDLAAFSDQRPGRKPIERNIHLITGSIAFKVAPNPRVETVVVTPAASFTAHGTEFKITVDKSTGETRIWVLEGLVDCFNPDLGLHISLGIGHHVILTSHDGELTVAIPEKTTGAASDPSTAVASAPLIIQLGEQQITAVPGTEFSLRIDNGGDLIVTVDHGQVLLQEPDGGETVVREGESANAGPPPDPDESEPAPTQTPTTIHRDPEPPASPNQVKPEQ